MSFLLKETICLFSSFLTVSGLQKEASTEGPFRSSWMSRMEFASTSIMRSWIAVFCLVAFNPHLDNTPGHVVLYREVGMPG